MRRRYGVWVGGKALTIAEGPPGGALPKHWLALRVDGAEGIATALRTLAASPDTHGIWLFSDGQDLWKAFRSLHVPVRAAGGVVTDEHGRLLAIRRLGKWDLPKGKVDKGEGVEEAALREVREECGLRTLAILRPLTESWHTYERDGKSFLKRTGWFLMRGTSEEPLMPQEEEGIEEVRWLDAAGVARMKEDTYPSLLPVITAWEGMRT